MINSTNNAPNTKLDGYATKLPNYGSTAENHSAQPPQREKKWLWLLAGCITASVVWFFSEEIKNITE